MRKRTPSPTGPQLIDKWQRHKVVAMAVALGIAIIAVAKVVDSLDTIKTKWPFKPAKPPVIASQCRYVFFDSLNPKILGKVAHTSYELRIGTSDSVKFLDSQLGRPAIAVIATSYPDGTPIALRSESSLGPHIAQGKIQFKDSGQYLKAEIYDAGEAIRFKPLTDLAAQLWLTENKMTPEACNLDSKHPLSINQ
jgi:hypothetical protein